MRRLHVLVTAGPTREPLDPVRFLSNRSSGKMGYALAEAALAAGHDVTLVSGPVNLSPQADARTIRVETAAEMRTVVLKEARRADVVIMAAAVADYQPASRARHKIKKRKNGLVLRLQKTPDILAELGRRKPQGQLLVGFAAETHRLLIHARQKLQSKNLDLIIANRVGKKTEGFEADVNRVIVLDRDGHAQRFPLMNKKKLSRRLITLIFSKLNSAC